MAENVSKKYQEMLSLYEQAKAEKGDPIDFYSYFSPALPHLTASEREDSLKKSAELLQIYPHLRPYHLLHQGSISLFNGRFSDAIEQLKEGQVLFLELKSLTEAGGCSALLSACYRSLGQFDEALSTGRQAIKLLEGTEDGARFFMFRSVAFYQTGELCLLLNEVPQAIELYKKGISFNEKEMLGRLHSGLATAYLQGQQYEAAEQEYQKSLELLRMNPNPLLESKIYSDLGLMYSKQKRYDEALLFHEKSLDIRINLGSKNAIVTSYLSLAELFLEMGDFEKALFYGKKGAEVGKEINLKIKLFEAERILAEAYKRQGKHEDSLRHYESFHQLREEVHNMEAARKLEQINTLHEIEIREQQKEIFRLRNVELKNAFDQISQKNKELQETLDELTKSKISRKAIAVTLVMGISLCVLSEVFIDPMVEQLTQHNLMSIGIKILIGFLMKPFETFYERYLTKNTLRKREKAKLQPSEEAH